jgi:hypothetical protein
MEIALIRDGWNEIVIYNDSAVDLPLVGVELAIRRKQPSSAA